MDAQTEWETNSITGGYVASHTVSLGLHSKFALGESTRPLLLLFQLDVLLHSANTLSN